MKDNLKDLLDSFAGITESAKGKSKEHLYKKEYFTSDDSDKQKNEREKIRKKISDIFKSLNTYSLLTDKSKYNQLADKFFQFYFAVFIKTDFSVSSIMSDNSKNTELRDLLKKHLPNLQKRYEETNQKEETKKDTKKGAKK